MKKYKIIFFFFAICLLNSGEAQVILDDNWEDEIVETTVQVLPITGEKSIDKKALLSGDLNNQFVPFNSDFITGEQTENWLKLNVKNKTDKPKNLYLGTNKFEYMRFWTIRDTVVSDEMLGGHLRPFDEKQVPIEGFSFFNFQIAPQESVDLILHIENKTAPITPQNHVPLSLMTEAHFNEFYKEAGNLTFMFIGAGIIMALFNFLFFLVNRFRAFLYYTLYIISIIMFVLSLKPDFAWAVFGHMDINKPFLSTAGTAGLLFYVLVGRELLRTAINFPKADRFLKAIVALETFSLFAAIIFPSLLTLCALINFGSALTGYPLLLVLGGIQTFKKDKGGTYFFIASSFYITSVTIMIFQMLGILPPKVLGMTSITITELGVAFELALFSLGLGAIFNDFRDRAAKEELESARLEQQKNTEQKQFLEEQNQILESKINDRTKAVFAKKEELETALNNLQTAQNQLIESEKMASLGQFTAGVAAEIKNPINFVSNGVENLEENSRDMIEAFRNFEGLSSENFNSEQLVSVFEKNKKIHLAEAMEDSDGLFKTVENGVERTLKIVNSLRNFARLDESDYKTANIHDGIDATIEILQSQFKDKAEIIRNYGKLPPVLCYPGKLNQVFLNLINNAVAATPKDSGRIEISTEYNESKDEVLISVANNGESIPKEYHEKIFEPFYTLGEKSKKKGLGLSICRRIMDQHNGNITVESEQGKDTVFRLRLPANPAFT